MKEKKNFSRGGAAAQRLPGSRQPIDLLRCAAAPLRQKKTNER